MNTVSADIPEQYLTSNKTMSVNCIDDEGVDDYVLITMFGAPWVD